MTTPRRSTRRTKTAPPANGRGSGLRERLKRDRFLFLLCLGALALLTAVFALTWWVTGGVVALGLALASLVPAFFLFYLRDA
jgi:Flp pilus assembly protein TadB